MRGTELGQCSRVTAARRRPAFLSLVCHTGLPGEGTRTQGKSVKEKGTEIMGERRQALRIGYHLPPNIDVLLKERERESKGALAVQVPVPWLQLSVLFWKKGAGLIRLHRKCPVRTHWGTGFLWWGPGGPGALAALLGDLEHVPPLPSQALPPLF